MLYRNDTDGKTKIEDEIEVKTVSNNIYFYSGVSTSSVLQLHEEMTKLEESLLYSSIIQHREPASILLHINSHGGGLLDSFAAMDIIQSCRVPVTTIIEGACASGATFLSLAGKYRIIRPLGFMLIHQLSSTYWGKYRELKDDLQNSAKFMETMRKVYNERTKIPSRKLDELLDHDLWLDAATCLEYGMVDEVK